MTCLSLGLGAEACVRFTRVLASELGSLGGSLPAGPTRPCPWSPPTPGSVPPSCSGRYPLNTCTGGAILARVHCEGPAVMEDRRARAEGEGPRRKAHAWLQAGKTLTPPQAFRSAPSGAPPLEPLHGPLCQPLLSPWTCRGPVHLGTFAGAALSAQKPPAPAGAPSFPSCPWHQVWGRVVHLSVCGFRGCFSPWLLSFLRAGTISSWPSCNLGDK